MSLPAGLLTRGVFVFVPPDGILILPILAHTTYVKHDIDGETMRFISLSVVLTDV